MTISHANAANVIADEFILQAERGIDISENTRQAMCILLDGASRALSAGYHGQRFKIALAAKRRLFVTRARSGKMAREAAGA